MNNLELKKIRKKLGLTQKELAEKLGVSVNTIQNYEGGGVIPSSKNKILGSLINDLSSQSELQKDKENKEVESFEEQDFYDRVPLIPVEAMAGSLAGFSEGVDLRYCRKVNSPVPGADYAIQISGDSMEPDYPNGSLLYIKKINANIFIPWGNPVILDTENGAVFKKIFKNMEDPEYIIARSINKNYPDLDIYALGIYGIYKVVGMARINSTI